MFGETVQLAWKTSDAQALAHQHCSVAELWLVSAIAALTIFQHCWVAELWLVSATLSVFLSNLVKSLWEILGGLPLHRVGWGSSRWSRPDWLDWLAWVDLLLLLPIGLQQPVPMPQDAQARRLLVPVTKMKEGF